MNVIISYLDSMFLAYPATPRMKEAKAELQAMMEDAYASFIAEGATENEAVGRVIRDFGNLEEVAPVLGIATELSTEPAAEAITTAIRSQHAPVTIDEAHGYADALQRIRYRVSTAIVLFVLSPAGVVLLPAAASSGVIPVREEIAIFLGILMILVLAAIGVIVLITTARETAPFAHIAEKKFTPNPAVTRWADALAAEHDRARVRALQIAIALWISAPIALIAFALLLDYSPFGAVWVALGVVIVLVFVAAGLAVLLPHTWAATVAQNLGDASGLDAADEDDRRIVGVIAAFYWPLVTAIFLAWSFIGSAWGTSWIIWPVAAVLFGAIAAGGEAIEGYRRSREHSRP
jgi:hypothetical protein